MSTGCEPEREAVGGTTSPRDPAASGGSQGNARTTSQVCGAETTRVGRVTVTPSSEPQEIGRSGAMLLRHQKAAQKCGTASDDKNNKPKHSPEL
ncbi:unnamed protein product [Lampetra fluviatilis]